MMSETKPDLRFKRNNPLAGTRQPARPTATRPTRTIAELKAVQAHAQQQQGQRHG